MKASTHSKFIRWLFARGREHEFLIPSEIQGIPRSTRSTWRNYSDDVVMTLEKELLNEGVIENFENWQQQFHDRHQALKQRAVTLNRRLIEFVGKTNYYQLLESRLEEFVDFIESQSHYFSKSDLLHWFGVSIHKYRSWRSRVNYECLASFGQLCAKKHPLQLTPHECILLERSLDREMFSHWPGNAVHSYLLRNNELTISRSTFYKYLARIKPKKKKRRKEPSYIPIRAKKPNACWHVDLSVFYTRDDQRCLIYALIDNYSRKVLGWRCTDGNADKRVVGAIIAEALDANKPDDLVLLSDGGPENVNMYMRRMVAKYSLETGNALIHKVAMKSIRKSNSMIERFFRLMKYDYLHQERPENIKELRSILKRMINEYNHVRPHYSLDHRTPDEAFREVPPTNFSDRLKKARVDRFNQNRNCSCQKCVC